MQSILESLSIHGQKLDTEIAKALDMPHVDARKQIGGTASQL